jgi:hypothetical protein
MQRGEKTQSTIKIEWIAKKTGLSTVTVRKCLNNKNLDNKTPNVIIVRYLSQQYEAVGLAWGQGVTDMCTAIMVQELAVAKLAELKEHFNFNQLSDYDFIADQVLSSIHLHKGSLECAMWTRLKEINT